MSVPEVSVQELQALKSANADIIILDVRNPDEYAVCNLGGYLIPYPELPMRFKELDAEKHIIVHCHAGGRARRATEFLLAHGFQHVSNLRGGISAWAKEIDPSMST